MLQGEDPTLDALASRVATLEGGAPAPVPSPAPKPAPKTAARAAKPPTPAPQAPPANTAPPDAPVETNLTLQRLEHHWPAIVDRVREKRPSISGHLARARLVEFDGSTLTIAVPDETTLNMLRGELDLAGQTLANLTKRDIAIKTIVAPSAQRREEPADDAADLLGYAVRKLST
jgi:hypothetical protein